MRVPIFLAAMALSAQLAGAATLSRETSPGGRDFILVNMPDEDKVAVRVAWPTDWTARQDANQAVPYAGTRLVLTGGAEGYPPGEVVEIMADLGAQADLFAYAQTVNGQLDVKRENLEEAVAIVNAHLRAPLLPENWFNRAREENAAGSIQRVAKPADAAFDSLRWTFYGDAPLRRFIGDEPPDRIRAYTLADVAAWQRSVFTANPQWIVVAGPLDAAAAGQAVDQLLAGLPAASASAPLTTVADMRPRRILLHLPDANTSTIFLAGPLPPTSEGWMLEDEVLFEALNRDFMDRVRTELRATYGISFSQRYDTDHIAFFTFSGEMEAHKLAAAEETLRKGYAAFRDGDGPGDFEKLKPFTLQTMRDRVEEPAGAAAEVIYTLETGQNLDVVSAPEKVLDAVTPSSLKARMERLLPPPEALTVLAVSPDRDALPGACVITRPEQAAQCK